MSEVVGRTFKDLAHSNLHILLEEPRRQLEKSMELLYLHDVKYLDERFDNFFLCDAGGIMIIDLEYVEFPPVVEDLFEESINYRGVGSLLYLFNDIRERKDRDALGKQLSWKILPFKIIRFIENH